MTVPRTICLGFLAVILAGAFLLCLPISTTDGNWSNPITGLFISTSAVCVTGLSVVDVGKYYTFWGQLWIAVLAQIGGLGYMTATTILLLLIGRRFGLKERIALQQSLDKAGLSGVVDLVKSIVATTAIFELTGVFLLMLVFVPQYGFYQGLWHSIFHSVSAFNNAGFGLFSDNLMGYVNSPIVNLTISGLIIFGGIGYQVIMEMYLWLVNRIKGNKMCTIFSLNFRIATSTTIFLLVLGTLSFLLIESLNPNTLEPLNLQGKILAAWFQSVTPRTAGFNTIDIGKMTVVGLWLTIALMFIGASPGGTGGGIKTTTFRVLSSCTQAVLKGKDEVTCYKRKIPTELILKAVAVQTGSLFVVIFSTILVAVRDPQLGFLPILFEAVSAFATVGLSTGITAKLSPFSELVIIATMYIGRVGVLLLMAAIIGDVKRTQVHYPEENLLVG